MKKLFSILLILTIILGSLTLPVFAKRSDNIVPENNSTFESGTTDWTALAGGTVSVSANPDGKGNVLKYTDIPDKSFACPWFDMRPYIQGAVSRPATVFGSIDIFSSGEELKLTLRMRTQTEDGFSKCKEAGANYCNLATGVSVPEGEWTTVRFQFDVTAEDLESTENWSFAFDGIYNHSTELKPNDFYIDNFTLCVEELSDEAFQPLPAPEEVESEEVILAQTSANLIDAKNSIFGAGTPNWSSLGGGVLSVVDNPSGEGKVLEWSEIPESTWATPWFDMRPYILNYVSEPTTIYGSVDLYCPDTDLNLQVRVRTNTENGFSLCTKDKKNYCSLTKGTVYAGTWLRINFSFTLNEADICSTEQWNFCFDNIFKDTVPEGFYIDNFYIGTKNPDDFMEKAPIPEKTPVERNETTLVGTIRWDCFTKSTPGDTTGVSSQVANVLSPKKYHWQAPFFSNVEKDDTISFPEYTLETWEQEATYAIEGGLNYFGYLWYESSEDMSQPRKMHLKSSKKNTIKMAGILEGIKSDQTMAELYDAMKDACYLTASGRPIVFLYGLDDWTEKDVLKLRQDAANSGVKKALYIVGMSFNTKLTTFTENINKDIDAVSWYSVGASKTGETFEELAKKCEEGMRVIGGYCLVNGIDLIPAFTAGRDTRARIETGVSWVDGDPNAENDYDKPYHNWFAYSPTMDELEKHMNAVISYAKEKTDICLTNMVCSYGWNEHEEGGWLCPTLLCDENGDLILDKDGNKQANTERLDTLKKVLKDLNIYAEPVEKTPKPTNSGTTPKPDTDSSFTLWWIIPAAVVVLGGAVTVAIILKKKKANGEPNE